MLCDLGDVKQAVGAGEEFDERAELRQPDNFAKVGLADLRNRGDVADHSERLLQTICVARRNVDPTGVIHINLGASLLNDAANGSAALANEIPNLVGGNHHGFDAGRIGRALRARSVQHCVHLVQKEDAAATCLLHRLLKNLASEAADLDIHLQSGDALAGTRKGITALQMDIKIGGLTREILQQAMEQARRGRIFLLDKMDAVLDGPRTERSAYAPRIETVMIPTDKIRDLIGKGGATIRGIIEQTGAKIDVDDTGRVSVASSHAEGLKKALEIIGNITAVPEIGKVYLGKVVRLAEFGAFVELFPGTDGLLHISEIAEHRVKEVKDELREGDQVMVKVLAIEGNRIKLSRKALIKELKAKLGTPAPAEAEEVEFSASESPAASAAPVAPQRQNKPDKPVNEFDERQPKSNQSTILIEGGDDFDQEGGEEIDEENEPNFNRVDGAPAPVAGQPAGAGRPKTTDNKNRRRRRRPEIGIAS